MNLKNLIEQQGLEEVRSSNLIVKFNGILWDFSSPRITDSARFANLGQRIQWALKDPIGDWVPCDAIEVVEQSAQPSQKTCEDNIPCETTNYYEEVTKLLEKNAQDILEKVETRLQSFIENQNPAESKKKAAAKK